MEWIWKSETRRRLIVSQSKNDNNKNIFQPFPPFCTFSLPPFSSSFRTLFSFTSFSSPSKQEEEPPTLACFPSTKTKILPLCS